MKLNDVYGCISLVLCDLLELSNKSAKPTSALSAGSLSQTGATASEKYMSMVVSKFYAFSFNKFETSLTIRKT